jgi:hypothetical protein
MAGEGEAGPNYQINQISKLLKGREDKNLLELFPSAFRI